MESLAVAVPGLTVKEHSEKISLSIINPAADKPVHSDLLLFQILFLIKLHREGERQREEERMGRAVKE